MKEDNKAAALVRKESEKTDKQIWKGCLAPEQMQMVEDGAAATAAAEMSKS